MRYHIISDSDPGNDGSPGYTVVDTAKPLEKHTGRTEQPFKTMCECYDREDAEIICVALNAGMKPTELFLRIGASGPYLESGDLIVPIPNG